jgi:uncharacterized protein (DUF1330 family)
MMVGLQVTDDSNYTKYREGMTPILKSYGGGFRYDFKVSETLINDEGRPINRVFAIYFEDKNKMDNFFKDDQYAKVKAEFFEGSVEATTILSGYER